VKRGAVERNLTRMGRKVIVCEVEGKRPLRRPGCRLDDDITVDIIEFDRMGGHGLDSFGSDSISSGIFLY